jgi:hypothetical protein
VPAKRLRDRVGGEAPPQEVLKDLSSIFGFRTSGDSSSQQDPRNAFSLILCIEVADQLTRQIPIDAARLKFANDPEPASVFDAASRPHVRGRDAPVVERAVGDESSNGRIRFAFLVAFGEQPFLEFRRGVIASADELERRGERLRESFYACRKTTPDVISWRRRQPARAAPTKSRPASASCGDRASRR